MTAELDLGTFEIDEDTNGDLVIREPDGNEILKWDDSEGDWLLQGQTGTTLLQWDESAGDWVINDTDGNTVLRWDESATEWKFQSNPATGLSRVATSELNGALTGNTALTDITGSNLTINSGILDVTPDLEINQVSSNTTTSGGGIYLVDTSGGAVTLTLASNDASNEESIGVVNITGSNNVTVETESTETIDPGGASSKTLSTEGWLVWFSGDGNNWDSSLDIDVEEIITNSHTISDLSVGLEKTTDQSLSADTQTTVDWDSQDVDSNLYSYDTSADSLDVLTAGDYTVSFTAHFSNVDAGEQVQLFIVLNGSVEKQIQNEAQGTNDKSFSISHTFKDLAANDTVKLEVQTGLSNTLFGNTGGTFTFASVTREG